jgi:uncharacterized protein (DUF2336 family)
VDGILAEKISMRRDISPPMFRDLLTKPTAVVHRRLLASATPEVRAEIYDALAKVSGEVDASVGQRDYRTALRTVLGLHQTGRMNEAALAAFCTEGKYDEAVAALAALAKVPIEVADQLMDGDKPDPVLILCKAAGLSWPTVKALIMARPDQSGTSTLRLEAAFVSYGRLSVSAAQLVVRFWQVRQESLAAARSRSVKN